MTTVDRAGSAGMATVMQQMAEAAAQERKDFSQQASREAVDAVSNAESALEKRLMGREIEKISKPLQAGVEVAVGGVGLAVTAASAVLGVGAIVAGIVTAPTVAGPVAGGAVAAASAVGVGVGGAALGGGAGGAVAASSTAASATASTVLTAAKGAIDGVLASGGAIGQAVLEGGLEGLKDVIPNALKAGLDSAISSAVSLDFNGLPVNVAQSMVQSSAETVVGNAAESGGKAALEAAQKGATQALGQGGQAATGQPAVVQPATAAAPDKLQTGIAQAREIVGKVGEVKGKVADANSGYGRAKEQEANNLKGEGDVLEGGRLSARGYWQAARQQMEDAGKLQGEVRQVQLASTRISKLGA